MVKKSIKINYIYNVCYQILTLVTPLITAPYISRVLGADNIGRYSYANSIVSYFSLFAALGITTYGRRETAYLQENLEKRTRMFWETKLLQFFTSCLAMAVYGCFSWFQRERLFYIVFLFSILAVAVDVTWFFQGMEEFKKIVIRNMFFKIVNILYIFLAVKTRNDLLKYVFGMTFFLFLSNASLWFYLPRYVGKPEWSLLKPFRDVKTVISLFIPTIAIEVYTVLDKTMIGIITGNPFENGYYEQAIKLSKMTLQIVTAMAPVLIARIGYYFQKQDFGNVHALMYRGYRFVWFIGTPLCLGLMGISQSLVPWFFGEGFDKVTPLLKVLSLLILSIGLNNLTGVQYLIPTKRQNWFTFTVVIGAGINFLLNMILIRIMQSIGAAIASVIAETAITLIQFYLIREELSIKKIFFYGFHYWIASGIMLVVLFLEERYLPPTMFTTCIMIGSGGIIYITILCILRDEFFLDNLHSVLRQLLKRG